MKINMEILCVADIHGAFMFDLIEKVIKERRIENFFILGDFSPHGNIGSLEGVENFLKTFVQQKIYAIPGNCDNREILKIFDKFNGNYHKKIGNIKGVDADFLFFGGSNITPFNTIFEYKEDEIYDNLKYLFELSKAKKKILITHCPPFNTECDFAHEKHIGSTAIREIIKKFQPEINLCSHIHECYGKKDFIGKTKIINVGELRRGCVILKYTNGEFEIERIYF